MRTYVLRSVKYIFFTTPLWRYFLPIMKFDMTLPQLNFITESIRSVNNPGVVLEVGVGGGATSVIINQFMKAFKINRPFLAIDTFYGFTKEDILFEQTVRNKSDTYGYYRSNSKDWYQKTLLAHGINGAKVFKADASAFDYKKIGEIAFCLFDVDLYKPTKSTLPLLYERLVPGGIIIVDDCSPDESIYDGAGQAYREFCDENGLQHELVHGKLGVIRKPLV
jgi:O-methyltransferase